MSGSGSHAAYGPFEVVRELARGGMGAVFEVRHRESGVRYALKTILGGGALLEAERERFEREAELTARLDHPGVIRIHAAELQSARPYLVVDLLSGGSLGQRLQGGPLELEAALEVGLALARAVSHAHSRGVLHRDLKPANVMFDELGRPRLVDWGLARSLRRDTLQLTNTGELLGTPSYMSPEQALGQPACEASDVYGLGALLFAMLTGRPPVEGDVPLVVLERVLHEEPPPLRSLRPDLPRREGEGLEALLRACLEKDPDRRLPLAALLGTLEALLRGERSQLASGPSLRTLGLGAALLLVAGLGASLLGWRAHVGRHEQRVAAAGAEALALRAELDAELGARARGESPVGRTSQARLAELLELVPADHEGADLLRTAQRLRRWAGGAPVEAQGTSALGAVLDGLILRQDLNAARRMAARAIRLDPQLESGWILRLELARGESPRLTRVARALLEQGALSAARAHARALLRAQAGLELAAYPEPERPALDQEAFEGARALVRLLVQLGCPADEWRAVVTRGVEGNAASWVGLIRGGTREQVAQVFAQLAGIGPKAVPLGPKLRATLRSWQRGVAAYVRQVSQDLAARPRFDRESERERRAAAQALERALHCERLLALDHRGLAPEWSLEPALLTETWPALQVATLQGRAAVEAAHAILRAPKGPMELRDLCDRLLPDDVQALLDLFPASRSLRLLRWRVSAEGQLRSLAEAQSWLAALRPILQPAGEWIDDLGPSYLGEAEVHAASAARYLVQQSEAPVDRERLTRFGAELGERALGRELPKPALYPKAADCAWVCNVSRGEPGAALRVLKRALDVLQARVTAAQSELERKSWRRCRAAVLVMEGEVLRLVGRGDAALETLERATTLARGAAAEDVALDALVHVARELDAQERTDQALERLGRDPWKLSSKLQLARTALQLWTKARGHEAGRALLDSMLELPLPSDQTIFDEGTFRSLSEADRADLVALAQELKLVPVDFAPPTPRKAGER